MPSGSGENHMTDGEASDDSEDEIQRRRSRRARFVPEPQEEPEDRTGPGNREEPRFTSGQSEGGRFSTILEEKLDSYFWAVGEKQAGKTLKGYIDWVQKHDNIQDKLLSRKADPRRTSSRADTPPKEKGKRTQRKTEAPRGSR